jgi:hypothetical protein
LELHGNSKRLLCATFCAEAFNASRNHPQTAYCITKAHAVITHAPMIIGNDFIIISPNKVEYHSDWYYGMWKSVITIFD